MTQGRARIPPIPAAEWSQEARDAQAVLSSSAAQSLGSSANLSMTMANHPALAKAYYHFGRHLLRESSLPDRPRELVTLRVAWRYKAEYEWHHHVRFAQRIGLSEQEIEAAKAPLDGSVLSGVDLVALRVVDELCATSAISDATWRELSTHLDHRQIMDLVFTIGQYVMLGWAISAFGVEVEEGFRSEEHPLA